MSHRAEAEPPLPPLVAIGREPFAALERSAGAHYAALRAARGAAATVALGEALYAHARALRPDWPTARDRADDLRDLAALRAILDRVPRVR